MLSALWLLSSALIAAVPQAPPPAVRALFVGVDQYLYSRKRLESADFNDLNGAVGDVRRIKQALKSAYKLDLDQEGAGCASRNAVSITITDFCATRAAILAGFADRLKASRPGDTIIFFFAGHGAQAGDDQAFDQASGFSDTILPTDARSPDATELGELLDREIRELVDGATAKGVNVVTMFDSCHSGTGIRGGHGEGVDRFVDGVDTRQIGRRRSPPPRPAGPGGGYRVHLAAADDSQKAREIHHPDDSWAGVFTTALAQTIAEMPNAAFGDIAAEVRRKVEQLGHSDQTPQAEGELRASLGGKAAYATLLAATPVGSKVVLSGAGRLAGMTVGSRFSLFGSMTEGLADKSAPLATATVETVSAGNSTLKLEGAPRAALPARLYARETRHMFGAGTIKLRSDHGLPAARQLVEQVVAANPMLQLGEPPQFIVEGTHGNDPNVHIWSADGSGVASLGDHGDKAFPARLSDALAKIAKVQALVDLRTDPAQASTSFCISNDLDHDLKSCPPVGPTGSRLISSKPARLSVVNVGKAPRYIYVLAIDAAMGVTLLLPGNGGVDPAIDPGRPLQREIREILGGRYRFVTIAADAPIDAAALQQGPAGIERDGSECRGPFADTSCAGTAGAVLVSAPVGEWSATVSDVIVEWK